MELPVAWTVRAANESEQAEVGGLLDTLTGRGFTVDVAVLDKGYDGEPMHETCESRGIRPVIALKETPSGARPSGGARPASASPRLYGSRPDRLHPLIPHGTERHKAQYKQRTAVEREFGRLKNDCGLLPLRVRRLPRVTLHVNLTILAQLGNALTRM
jgi:transposase